MLRGSLVEGKHYFLTTGKTQAVAQFLGVARPRLWLGREKIRMKLIDTGEVVERCSAGSLSKHRIGCNDGNPACACSLELR